MNYYTITRNPAVMPSTAVPRSGEVTTITLLTNKKKYSYGHELLHHHKKYSGYTFNGRSALGRDNNTYTWTTRYSTAIAMNYYTITTKTAVMPSTAVPRSGGVTTITVLNNKIKYSYRHELLHHHKKNIGYAFNGRSARAG
jgi:hypothetical protein